MNLPDLSGPASTTPAVDGTAIVGPWSGPPRPKWRTLGSILIGGSLGLIVIGVLLSDYSQPECIGNATSCVYLPFDPYSTDAAIALILAALMLVFGLVFLLWVSSVPDIGVRQPDWLKLRCSNCGEFVDPSLTRCDHCGAPVG